MKRVYKEALDELIGLVIGGRDETQKYYKEFEESFGSLVVLGDKRFGFYSSMVDTNECRAAKAIENIAVTLFSEASNENFSLYPVDTALKSRPFQIVLTENKQKCGIVFSVKSDIGECYKKFQDGKYAVDALKIVIIANPDNLSRKIHYISINKFNKQAHIAIERIAVLDFWLQYFGETECDELSLFCEKLNEKAKEIIGFNTVIAPTDKALEHFREKCGKAIVEHDYTSNIPDTVFRQQVETMRSNYIDRGLYRAMTGKSNFAVSFITSEWFYTMYQMTENLDLTNIVTGYLKSIEQLLFAVVRLFEGTGITILSKHNGVVQFNQESANIIDPTLGVLEQVVEHNGGMLDIDRYAKEYLKDMIDDWRVKQRNGYFHKENLHDIKKVNEIREKAFQLYFLILGSCKIKDEQFASLGIEG